MPIKHKSLIFFVGISEGIGLIGSYFTAPAIPTWYIYLNKPSFTPPNWIFGLVWSLLYFLMGIAAFKVWQVGWDREEVKRALYYFGVQLLLNLLWSILFFGIQEPLIAYIEIIILIVFIGFTQYKFFKLSKIAGILLLPYIAWVIFASFLNLAIVLLN